VPVIPDPIMVYFVFGGRVGVVRWSAIGTGGVCQYDFVGVLRGRPTGILVRVIVE
jgi:hypothetical protein